MRLGIVYFIFNCSFFTSLIVYIILFVMYSFHDMTSEKQMFLYWKCIQMSHLYQFIRKFCLFINWEFFFNCEALYHHGPDACMSVDWPASYSDQRRFKYPLGQICFFNDIPWQNMAIILINYYIIYASISIDYIIKVASVLMWELTQDELERHCCLTLNLMHPFKQDRCMMI